MSPTILIAHSFLLNLRLDSKNEESSILTSKFKPISFNMQSVYSYKQQELQVKQYII